MQFIKSVRTMVFTRPPLAVLLTVLFVLTLGIGTVAAWQPHDPPRTAALCPVTVTVIETDTTWSFSECDAYIVESELTIASDATLTLEAGTIVRFKKQSPTIGFKVLGTLVARGAEGNPVIFTSDETPSSAYDWGKISFTASSKSASFDENGTYIGGSILQHVLMEYNLGISIDTASPYIDHVTIRNSNSGITVNNATEQQITNSTIVQNVTIEKGTFQISKNTAKNIIVSGGSGTISGNTLSSCIIWDRRTDDGAFTISDNTITGYCQTSSYGGSGSSQIFISGGRERGTISGNSVTGSTRTYYECSIYLNGASYSTVSDNIISKTGYSSSAAAICIDNGSSHTITNNSITENTGSGIYVTGGSTHSITNNSITNNKRTGVYIYESYATKVNDNNIYSNGGDVDLQYVYGISSPILDATNNWWGTIDENIIASHIEGVDNVNYKPIRTEEVVVDDASTPTPVATATPAPATSTVTPLPTNTPVPLPTNTPVPLPTNTPVPLPTNTPVPLPTNTPVALPTNTPMPQFTPTPVLNTTGRIVFESNRDGNSEIYVMNGDGTQQTNLTNNPASDTDPVWSPDGTRIAFTSNRDGNMEIYTMNADGSGLTRLTNNDTDDQWPDWSPDGTRIVYTAAQGSSTEIYVMNADGTGQIALTNDAANNGEPAWSPDGTRIAFSSYRDGWYRIYVMNADGSEQTRITHDDMSCVAPDWSPDSTQLAFQCMSGSSWEIYTANANGTGLQQRTNNNQSNKSPTWSPDGNSIVFEARAGTDTFYSLYVMRLDGTETVRLTTNGTTDASPDWVASPGSGGQATPTPVVGQATATPVVGEQATATPVVGQATATPVVGEQATATPVVGEQATPTPTTHAGTEDPSGLSLGAMRGYPSIQLQWAPPDDPMVTGYRVLRGVEGSNDMAVIATINDTVFFDTDTSLERNTTYCYQVETMRSDGGATQTSAPSCALYGAIELYIPDTWAGPGEDVIVPVNIRNANGLEIAAGDFWLDFDRTIIEPKNIARTALTADYAWSYDVDPYESQHSRARISSIASPPVPLYGSGSLFWLTFHVIGQEGDSSPLNLREFVQGVGGSSISSPDKNNPGSLVDIPLALSNGTFHVDVAYMLGDLNGNGVIQAADAYLALQIASGRLEPSWEQRNAGDVNGNGMVDAADATMILYHAAHQEWPTITENNASVLLAAATTDANNPTISIQDVVAAPGSTAATTVNAQDLDEWAGGDFAIAYDTDMVQGIANVAVTDFTSGFGLSFNDNGDGLLRVSLANGAPLTGDGALFTISVTLANDATVGETSILALSDARLNDIVGRDFATSALQKTVTRENGQITVGDSVGEPTERKVYLPLVRK